MDGKLVTDLPSVDRDGGVGRSSPIPRYGERFEALCGYYMSIGMSYHDYWDGDSCMTKYYREASELQLEQRNTELWLQGAYIYEALLDVHPVFNALSKKKTPIAYRSEPIPITRRGGKRSEEQKKRKQLENGKEAMRVMMTAINAQFKEKQEGGEVSDGS